jgi:hypothetical protein
MRARSVQEPRIIERNTIFTRPTKKENTAMRKISFLPAGFLLLGLSLGLLLSFLPDAAADDDCDKESIIPIGTAIQGNAILCVDAKGVRGKVQARALTPGDAYTIWFIYFDDPSQCFTPGQCGDPDFAGPDPLGVFGRFDSAVGPDNGKVDFSGQVRGLHLSSGSQVWLVVFGHGPANTSDNRHLARQLLTPEDPAAGAPHLGNVVDGLRGAPVAIAIFNIP